jgi:hypothetical protein
MSTVQQNIVLTLEKSESPVKNELEILPQDCFLVFAGSFSDGAEGETGNSSFLHLKRSGRVGTSATMFTLVFYSFRQGTSSVQRDPCQNVCFRRPSSN